MLISQKEIQAQKIMVPSWDYSGMTGIISLSLSDHPKAPDYKTTAQKILLGYADKLVEVSENSAYKVSLDILKWGSNSDVVNQALIKLVAYKISGNKKYLALLNALGVGFSILVPLVFALMPVSFYFGWIN